MKSYLIFFSTVIGTALLMIVLQKLYYKQLCFSKRLKQIALIILGLSMIFSVFMIKKFESALVAKSWPHTTGIVIEAKIAGATSYYPDIEYSYSINSQFYIGHSTLHAPMFGGKRKRHEVAEALVRDNPPGKKLQIYYNPINPSESMVNNSIDWKVYGQTGFALFMVLLSLWFGVVPTRRE